MRARVARGVFIVIALAGARAVSAQDCGNWPQPVLCDARLVAVDSDRREERLGARGQYRLAPRQRIELILDGRDQRGRPFPQDRLALRYDQAGCGRLLDIDERGGSSLRVTARTDAARCRLQVWVPGNLNFVWEIEFEVDPGARTTYSRRGAEYVVTALYQAVLGREPDRESFRSAVAEVQNGSLQNQIAAMIRSREFEERRGAVPPAEILDRFYQGVFGRQADTGGVREYLGMMQSGRYSDVLMRLIKSPEFERRLPD